MKATSSPKQTESLIYYTVSPYETPIATVIPSNFAWGMLLDTQPRLPARQTHTLAVLLGSTMQNPPEGRLTPRFVRSVAKRRYTQPVSPEGIMAACRNLDNDILTRVWEMTGALVCVHEPIKDIDGVERIFVILPGKDPGTIVLTTRRFFLDGTYSSEDFFLVELP